VRASRIVLALALGALVLAAAGCGGGGKSASSTTTTTETTSTAAQSSTTTTTTTASTTTGANVSGIASASNCRELADLSGKLAQAFGGTPSADSKKYAAFLQAYAERAPADIRPDFQTLADAYSKIAGALGGYTPGSTPSAAQLAKMMKAVQGLDQAKITQAGQNIGAWVQKNCAHR
jgi:hypothetical protein